jgi:hypothetical protein
LFSPFQKLISISRIFTWTKKWNRIEFGLNQSSNLVARGKTKPKCFQGGNLCTTRWGKRKAETDKFISSCWPFECHSARIVDVYWLISTSSRLII